MTDDTNRTGANATANLNETELMATMLGMVESMSLQNRMLNIPVYDGTNMALKDFLQDIRNWSSFIPPGAEAEYVSAIISRLRGNVRNCVYGKQINTVKELIKTLKSRLASGKTFDYYVQELTRARMKRDETIGQFFDRIRMLLSSGHSAWKEENGGAQVAENSDHLSKIALRSFIDGLPTHISEPVDMREPADLEGAFRIAE